LLTYFSFGIYGGREGAGAKSPSFPPSRHLNFYQKVQIQAKLKKKTYYCCPPEQRKKIIIPSPAAPI